MSFIRRKEIEEKPTSKTRCDSRLASLRELLGHGPGFQGEGGGVELDTWDIEVAALGGHGGQEVGNGRGGRTGELAQAGSTDDRLHPCYCNLL